MLHVRRCMRACILMCVCVYTHVCLHVYVFVYACMTIEDSFVGQEYDQCFALITGEWHQGLSTSSSTFGWIDIYNMWMRECERREKGHARMVPNLRETHIIRDSWTKLNVAPAKIMQV